MHLGLSNKVATNRSYYSNLRYINILQRQISALLRSWLWVRVPPNPLSICQLFPPEKQLPEPLGGYLSLLKNDARVLPSVALCCSFPGSFWPVLTFLTSHGYAHAINPALP